jgi:PilZ domain
VSADACIVAIAAADVLPAVQQRLASLGHEILPFNETEALKALEAILGRRPAVVAIERMFAAAPRGAALISRIKADPRLTKTEIRVVAHDSDYSRVSPRKADITPKALDQRGTRRAPRFKMKEKTAIAVDTTAGAVIDLSTIGAQVVTTMTLKPQQVVKLTLTDASGNIRLDASVAWASFEIPPRSGPRYRAGVEFANADAAALEAFCERHKAN